MKEDIAARFRETRALFEHTGNVTYFNSASYGPFCTPVRDAIRTNLDLRVAAERDDSHDAFTTSDELRNDFAELIGAEKKQVGLGMNTSFGLNIAAFGLPLKAGDEVLISDIEFPAVVYTWRAAAERRGLKIKRLASKDRFFDIDELLRNIGERTRVLSLSYVQFFNGYKNDLETISEICRKNRMYLVIDGIQGMGVEPLDVKKSGINVFTSGCHKWMLSPQGCGFFYLSDEVCDLIKPPFMSWLGVDWEVKFDDLFHVDKPYFDSARRFEMGFYAVLNILGMKAAVRIFQDLGIDNIQAHNHALIDRLADYIRGNSFYRITCSMAPKHRSSIFTFSCDNVDKLHRRLLDNKIILVNREGSIRVSVHLFNNEQDIDRLIEMLDGFSK
ncbi:MAG: aminotransferase class V-fold PLP-dependent enzyme [bacterium]|nr:aminotransferase class V-fold PLP-dependent enzyme [bacterium]